MLDEQEVLAYYHEKYELAISDGLREEASEVAWEWTQEAVENQFLIIKTRYQNLQQEMRNLSLENKPLHHT